MAGEQTDYSVVVNYESTGSTKTEAELRGMISHLDSLARAGTVTTKSQERISKALYQAGGAAHAGAVDYSTLGKAMQQTGRHAADSTRGVDALSGSLPTLRYALYDVARTAGTVNLAIGAAGAGALTLSSQFESAFTSVERTSGVTGAAVEKLRSEFTQLSREIPQSFADIADIGSRGAQLGVAAEDLSRFTEVVAQFVATSDTVSMGEAVEAFGRISNLLGDTDFNRIGSSITKVGVNAAATEGQIVKTTQELAPFATAVGMSAHETIGLATALASLGQPPERARSAFLTLQRVMDEAVASGSDNLQTFGQLLGVTADEVATLWKQNPAQFTTSFATALGNVDDLTTAFSELGIKERRAVQVFQALAADSRNAAGGMSVLSQAFDDAKTGYEDGTELANQYALIVDDLASKWRIFLNALQEFGATVGSVLAPAAKSILDLLSGIIQGFSDFASTPLGAAAVWIAASIGAVAFALTGVVTTAALAGAALLGTSQVMTGLAGITGTSTLTLRGLGAAFQTVAVQAGFSSRAVSGFKAALAASGIGLAVLAVGALGSAFLQTAETAEQTATRYLQDVGGLAEAIAADTAAFHEAASTGGAAAVESYSVLTQRITETAAVSEEAHASLRASAILLGSDMPSATNAATSAIESQNIALGDNVTAWARSSLEQSAAFQELKGDSDFVDAWEAIGADFNEVIRIAAAEGEQGVLNYFYALSQATENGGGAVLTGANAWFDQIFQSFAVFGRSIARAWNSLLSFDFADIGKSLDRDLKALDKIWSRPALLTGFQDMSKLSSGLVDMAKSAKTAGKAAAETGGDFEGLGDSAGKAADGGVSDLEEKLVSVKDYANDLQEVMSRAFELRFGVSQGEDAITKMWRDIKKASEEANQKISDYKLRLQELKATGKSLQSERDIKNYWLSIALEYGDTKRANALRAEIAKLDGDIAKNQKDVTSTNKDLSKAQQDASKALMGNSDAAIRNREALQKLIEKYGDQIVKLAESGLSQSELSEKTNILKKDFEKQAEALGFNKDRVKDLSKGFSDYKIVVDKVPRNVSTKLEVKGLGPAEAALKEFARKAKSSMSTAGRDAKKAFNDSISGIGSGIPRSIPAAKTDFTPSFPVPYNSWSSFMAAMRKAGFPYAKLPGEYGPLAWIGQSMGYAEGGYTGAGGKYEAAGVVHRGEYVIPKRDVNQSTGLPYADALGRHMGGARGVYASRGGISGGGGASTVALTAGTIQAIAHAVRPMLKIGDDVIAGAATSSFSHSAAVGAY